MQNGFMLYLEVSSVKADMLMGSQEESLGSEVLFCLCQVRSISINVRKNLAFNTLSQELLLKEFSTIS